VGDIDANVDLGIDGLGPAEHIGQGGFADVYRAEQLSLRRPVAVKVLRAPAADADAAARFQRECHALGAVSDHPHIVGLHEGGFTRSGRAYLVMEYLPGGSLADRLRRTGPLHPREACTIMAKVARALGVAHQAGVLHRDVKPANIMISAYGEPALGDFGVARIEGGHQTQSGHVTATLAHAAPEVLEGQRPSEAADVYALGSTLFELLVGVAPFHDASDASVWPLMTRIMSEPFPDPVERGVGPELARIIRGATERDPGARYGSAAAVAHDLRQLVDQQRGLTPPTPPGAPGGGRFPQGQRPSPQAEPGPVPPQHAPTAAYGEAVGPEVNTLHQRPGGVDPAVAQAPTASLPPPMPGAPPPNAVAAGGAHGSGPDAWGGGSTAVSGAERPNRTSRAGTVGTVLLALGVGLAVAAVVALVIPSPADSGAAPTVGFLGEADAPSQAGDELSIELDSPPPGAAFRVLIDGVVVGGPSDRVPALIAPPGVSRVEVEVTDGGSVELLAPILIAAFDPRPEPGFRAHLGRFPATAEGWAEAQSAIEALVESGVEGLEVFRTDDLTGMTPGAWLLSIGGFGEDADAAERACRERGLSIPDRCYPGRVAPVGA
jgi:serine/threonine protein kinase